MQPRRILSIRGSNPHNHADVFPSSTCSSEALQLLETASSGPTRDMHLGRGWRSASARMHLPLGGAGQNQEATATTIPWQVMLKRRAYARPQYVWGILIFHPFAKLTAQPVDEACQRKLSVSFLLVGMPK